MEASQAVDDSWRLKTREKKERKNIRVQNQSGERKICGGQGACWTGCSQRSLCSRERVQDEEMNNDC